MGDCDLCGSVQDVQDLQQVKIEVWSPSRRQYDEPGRKYLEYSTTVVICSLCAVKAA
jgi:hypothetical protein